MADSTAAGAFGGAEPWRGGSAGERSDRSARGAEGACPAAVLSATRLRARDTNLGNRGIDARMLIVDLCTAIAAAVLVLLPLGELLLSTAVSLNQAVLEHVVFHIPEILNDVLDDEPH